MKIVLLFAAAIMFCRVCCIIQPSRLVLRVVDDGISICFVFSDAQYVGGVFLVHDGTLSSAQSALHSCVCV